MGRTQAHSWSLIIPSFVINYGIKRVRGGVTIVEQKVIDTHSFKDAYRTAAHYCKRGEIVHSVEAIKDDLDLLDYNDMEVI
jgi:hypothetical protein